MPNENPFYKQTDGNALYDNTRNTLKGSFSTQVCDSPLQIKNKGIYKKNNTKIHLDIMRQIQIKLWVKLLDSRTSVAHGRKVVWRNAKKLTACKF